MSYILDSHRKFSIEVDENHIRLLVDSAPEISAAQIVRKLKAGVYRFSLEAISPDAQKTLLERANI